MISVSDALSIMISFGLFIIAFITLVVQIMKMDNKK